MQTYRELHSHFRLIEAVVCCLLWLALAATAFAQFIPTGTVVGTVKDQAGAVVPKATVKLTNTQTGITRSAVSNGRGEYLVPAVPAGTYRVTAAAPGFQRFTQELIVQAAGSTTVDVTLHVGAVKQVVQVNSLAPLLNTSSGTLSNVITNTQISNLPLLGQNALSLVPLTAGITTVFAPGLSAAAMNVNAMNTVSYFSANGGDFESNEFTLDGNPDNLTDRAQYMPPVNQIQEMSVVTNSYDAQYGHGSGAQVVMITKGGTNEFHGEADDFLQNTALNANNFFSNRDGLATPPVHINQFGASVGGPIRRNHAFFFFDYEGIRSTTPTTDVGTVPTAAQRSGDFSQTFAPNGAQIQIFNPFSTIPNPAIPGQYIRTQFPGNIIPATDINPASKGIFSLLPAPNRPGEPITGVNNYIQNVITSTPMNDYSGRVDVAITPANHLFARYSEEKTLSLPGTFLIPSAPSDTQQINTVLGITSTPSPTWVLQANVGWEGWANDFVTPRQNMSGLGFSPAFLSEYGSQYIPNFSISDMSAFGNGATSYDHDPTWGFNLNIGHTHGSQNIKWGFSWQVKQDNSGAAPYSYNFRFDRQFTQGPNPTLIAPTSGYGIASFLLGAMSPTTESFQATNSSEATTFPYYAAYFQDDVRLTPRLSVNAGVRWEVWQPATERYNRMTTGFAFNTPNPIQAAATANYALNPVPQLTPSQFSDRILGGLLYATPSNRRWGKTYWNDWDPRLGFAYRLRHNTVLRGGFGIYHSIYWGSFTRQGGFTAQTPVTASINGVTPVNLLDNPFPSGYTPVTGSSLGLATGLGSSLGILDPNAQPFSASRWDFGVQQEITPNTMLEVDYVGNTNLHLTVGSPSTGTVFTPTPHIATSGPSSTDRQFVYLPAQYLSLGSQLFTTVPNPFVGLIPSSSPLGAPTISLESLLNNYPEFVGVDDSRQTTGSSYYNALQVTATKRTSHGLMLVGTYTWSKDLLRDEFINTSDPGPSTMISNYDAPQRFTLSGVYQLPFGPGRRFGWKSGAFSKLVGGWQYGVGGVFQSGFPVTLGSPVNIVSGVDPTLSPSQRSVDDWFNLAALTPLPEFTLRTASWGLNSLRADAEDDWDMSLIKNTSIHERYTLQFRWELFNTFNRAQFGAPNVNPTSAAYGNITTQANQPRAMQVALRFLF